MRLKNDEELLAINLLSIALMLIMFFLPSNILRVILGIPFVIAFPGYALMVALFPRRGDISNTMRTVLTFVLSIVVIALLLMVLNYTPWGIRVETIFLSICIFIIVFSTIAVYRRRVLPLSDRFYIEFQFAKSDWLGRTRDKILSGILVLTILAALGTLGYAIAATTEKGQKFTEFYITSSENKTAGLPDNLKVGEEARVIIGVNNNEYEVVSYRVEVRMNNVKANEIDGILLEPGEKWEGEVEFTPQLAGDNQKVEFCLYRGKDGRQPYLEPLRLWVDVVP